MNDKLKELYEKVSGDDSLKESLIKGLEAISNDDEKKSFIIDFAKEQGITLTNEDFPETSVMQQLSDDDMENVTGGTVGDSAYRTCGSVAYAFCMVTFASAGVSDC